MITKYTIHEILVSVVSYSLIVIAWTITVLLVSHIAIQLVVWIL